jgi:Fe-S cluster biogenesis protein NfuA
LDDQQARELVGRVEASLESIESLPDVHARTTSAAALQGLLELYGEGLARMIAVIAQSGDENTLRAFAQDELVAHLLMLHDLHPVNVETRVQAALEEVRPYLATHGGNVELLGVESGVVHLRLQGSCSGCPSSTLTLKTAIEEAILKAAPDVLKVEAEGVVQEPPSASANFIPLAAISASVNGKNGSAALAPGRA